MGTHQSHRQLAEALNHRRAEEVGRLDETSEVALVQRHVEDADAKSTASEGRARRTVVGDALVGTLQPELAHRDVVSHQRIEHRHTKVVGSLRRFEDAHVAVAQVAENKAAVHGSRPPQVEITQVVVLEATATTVHPQLTGFVLKGRKVNYHIYRTLSRPALNMALRFIALVDKED